MKVLFLNYSFGIGSTGKIVSSLFDSCKDNGIEPIACYINGPKSESNHFRLSNKVRIKFNSLSSHIFGNYGFESKHITKRLIKIIEKTHPEIIHIHNIHSHDINIRLLFEYLAEIKIHVVFTFHDCWLFTGYCPYYTFVNCNKWKTSCNNCPVWNKYSFFFDRSNFLFKSKEKYLSLLNDATIISPSLWLNNEIHSSFLTKWNSTVINNGVDQDQFKITTGNLKEKYNLEGKTIILGVASIFDERKGIDTFIKLSKDLPDQFQIVLVGYVPKRIKLPTNIINI